ncbi:MAG TPA: cyclic nucleotide-binding domain-containing protein [Acetobacteraceae bacterium]|nr:cyclic nucleotide-binding domain-containing protein [Acetobacteraceae bacterium]
MRPGIAALQQIPVFAGLNDALLERINALSEVVTAAHGDRICQQGAVPDILYYLLEGQVALSTTAPDGSTAVVEVLQPGQDFVLASVMSLLPYLQSAHVVQRARLVAIKAEPLRVIIEREPELTLALLRSMSTDFRNLVRQIRDLKVRTTAQRLGAYLLALVPDPTSPTADFRLPFEKGLLAARLGCRQENLSRAFAALRELGVETHGARVTLREIPRLTAYAMPDYLTDPDLAKSAMEAAGVEPLSVPASA